MSLPKGKVGHYTKLDDAVDRLLGLRRRLTPAPVLPTLVHVTHPKAGSTWISNILEELFHTRCAPRGYLVAGGPEQLKTHRFEAGRVYRGMFFCRRQFSNYPELQDSLRFIVIRDLRDTLVSFYFSIKYSHPEDAPGLANSRAALHELSEEDGLLYCIDHVIQRTAEIQTTWLDAGEIVLLYEDLLARPAEVLTDLLVGRWALPISASAVRRAIRRTHFETVYRRKLGEENEQSHGRRGLPGDWRNRFTPAIRERFAQRFGDVLTRTGYEPDDSWVEGESSPRPSHSMISWATLATAASSLISLLSDGIDCLSMG